MNTIYFLFVCWENLSAPPAVHLLPPSAPTFFRLAGGATITWFLGVFCLLFVFMLKKKKKTASLEQSRTALSNVLKSQGFVPLEMLPLE